MFEEDRKGGDNARPTQPFTVRDRRKFTADGELRSGEEREVDEAQPPPPSPPRSTPSSAPTEPGFERRSLGEPEDVNLTMLVSAMAQQALRFLGEIPDPSTGQAAVEPEQARLQIDLIDLLRVKCRGNLTLQEEGLLDQALYQLRMLYVARTQQRS